MKEKFTSIQKANVVLWYAISVDTSIVQNKFKLLYSRDDSKMDVPSAEEIEEWYRNFKLTGYTDDHDAIIHGEMTGEVLSNMEHRSKTGLVLSTILKKLNYWLLDGPNVRTFHPYHMEVIKHHKTDFDERKKFAKCQLERIQKWSHVLHTMWFTGEAKFYTDGRVESNNLIYTNDLSKEDDTPSLPHKTVKQYTPSEKPFLTVWSAINSEMIIGPYFFLHPYTSDDYMLLLKKFATELHKITSKYEHPIFVQDDSKLHSNTETISFLEKEFPHHWIGKGSSYDKWPHHSPDLSPINYFLWGYIKSRVYKTPIEDGNLDEIKKRVQESFKNITFDLLEEAIADYKTRLERVVKTNGHLVDATVYGEEIDYDLLQMWSISPTM